MIHPFSKYNPLAFLFDEEEPWVFVGMMDGKPAWSQGHMIILGNPPMGSRTKAQDFSGPLSRLSEHLVQIVPVAFDRESAHFSVVLFSNGHSAMADKFYKAVLLMYPGATFWALEQRPVLDAQCAITVRSAEGERVAIVMPMRWTYGDLADIVKSKPEGGES